MYRASIKMLATRLFLLSHLCFVIMVKCIYVRIYHKPCIFYLLVFTLIRPCTDKNHEKTLGGRKKNVPNFLKIIILRKLGTFFCLFLMIFSRCFVCISLFSFTSYIHLFLSTHNFSLLIE